VTSIRAIFATAAVQKNVIIWWNNKYEQGRPNIINFSFTVAYCPPPPPQSSPHYWRVFFGRAHDARSFEADGREEDGKHRRGAENGEPKEINFNTRLRWPGCVGPDRACTGEQTRHKIIVADRLNNNTPVRDSVAVRVDAEPSYAPAYPFFGHIVLRDLLRSPHLFGIKRGIIIRNNTHRRSSTEYVSVYMYKRINV